MYAYNVILKIKVFELSVIIKLVLIHVPTAPVSLFHYFKQNCLLLFFIIYSSKLQVIYPLNAFLCILLIGKG